MRIVQRWKRWWGLGLVVTMSVAACDGDDDADETTTEPSVESTLPPATTEPSVETTARATTTSSTTTTVAPTTTESVEDLKTEIAEDYLRSWELRRELTENPTLDGLDAKLAQISAPGSADHEMLRDFITELVTLEERIVAGTPDEFRVDVEQVELVGEPPYDEATVTICYVRNRVRVDAAGSVVLDNGIVASRSEDHVVRTPEGWKPDQGFEDLWQGLEVTECPPA